MSTIAVNAITNAAGGNTATINGMTPTAQSLQGFRNRIINGGMVIDQRNAGSSQSVANGSSLYTLDRWRLYYDATSATVTSQQSTTTTTGFSKSLSLTVGTAGSIASGTNCTLTQLIEGFNCEDLALSTSAASPLSLSFWVRSSVTGTFNASITVNGYSYVSTYTINAANTFEYKTIAIPALTVGTPAAINNSAYINLRWDLGCGSGLTTGTANSWVSGTFYKSTGTTNLMATSGATFYITGVQLEAGSVATPFERRPYGTELALCQRYYQEQGQVIAKFHSPGANTTRVVDYTLSPEMRAVPTVSVIASGEFTSISTTNRLGNTNKLVCIDGTVGNAGNFGFVDRIAFIAEL